MAPEKIYFYSKDQKYGDFSNFALFGIEIGDLWYPTVEHYFQSQKFNDHEYSELIRKAETPKKAAVLGKSREYPIKKSWDEMRYNIMLEAVTLKFTTHSQLKELLLQTNEAELIENSPYDYFWGCGSEGTGQNNLGKILMAVRAKLKA